MRTMPDSGYLLDQLLHSSLDVIYFKDTGSRFTMYNRACAEKHGWDSLEEGIGLTDFDLFTIEHAQKAFDDERRILATGTPLHGIEEKETWPDGRITWCSSTKVPMRNAEGGIVGIVGITRDITKHKEDEFRIARYTEQIRNIKEMLEEDARMAGRLQRSLFMTDVPVFPKGVDAAESCLDFRHHLKRTSLVGGVYCSIRGLSDTCFSILACEIGGAGARAALGAALIRGIMQDIGSHVHDPSAYLGRLNEQLYPLLHPEERLLLNVSACYMVVDLAAGRGRLASAGYPLPLHFRADGSVKWLFENLVLNGPALAETPHTRYRTISCDIQSGDSVVLYTDGLVSVHNARGEPFCDKRVMYEARVLSGKTLDEIFHGLEEEALLFSAHQSFEKDVSLVGFHVRNLLEAQ